MEQTPEKLRNQCGNVSSYSIGVQAISFCLFAFAFAVPVSLRVALVLTTDGCLCTGRCVV